VCRLGEQYGLWAPPAGGEKPGALTSASARLLVARGAFGGIMGLGRHSRCRASASEPYFETSVFASLVLIEQPHDRRGSRPRRTRPPDLVER
jgi:hypothetical protein